MRSLAVTSCIQFGLQMWLLASAVAAQHLHNAASNMLHVMLIVLQA
jgi:hypothetical protein